MTEKLEQQFNKEKEPILKKEVNVAKIIEEIEEERRQRGFLRKIAESFKNLTRSDFEIVQQRRREIKKRVREEIDKIKKSMPDDLKEKLDKIVFNACEGAVDANINFRYQVKGLNNAIEAAKAAGAAFNYNTGWATTTLSYEDGETKVLVSGASNGWSTCWPAVHIIHKNQEYYWEDPTE